MIGMIRGGAAFYIATAFVLGPLNAADGEGEAGQVMSLDTLSLSRALEISESNGSPGLDVAESQILESSAELDSVKSKYGVRVKAELAPRYVYAIDDVGEDNINDSYYFLSTSKVLTDFGQTEKLSEAAEAELRASAIDFVSERFRRRLLIVRAYMNVLLSDLKYLADYEKMVVKFLRYDKKRERHELGEVADVDLLELESAYREELINSMRSENRQSESRAELAALLNRPDDFPATLNPININLDEVAIPEYEELLEKVLALNPELTAQQQRVKAAEAKLEHSKMTSRPVLDSALELGNYERRYGEGAKWRLGLNLTIPFREGGRLKAERAGRLAQLQQEQARYKEMKILLRKKVLELVQELRVLKTAVQSANLKLDYRDLYLDRSRSAYELEVQTNLGDAAAEMSEAQWYVKKVQFDLLLTLGSIDALQGIDPAQRLLE
jgi:outer membrane protein TolC